MYEWNQKLNLTRVPAEECETKHFIDSVLISPFCPLDARVLDMGTGPGFPAWPLALVRPDLDITALDGSNKLLFFLKDRLLSNMRIVQERGEDFRERERFDLVTGRAIAPLAIQLELAAAFAKVGGAVVPFRTPSDRSDLESFPAHRLGLELESLHEVPLTGTDVVRLFPVFRKRVPTAPKYPRPWAQIKAEPLGRSSQPAS
jgi:16S rRNA (guanine527-N7)-methyltransferase